jgi:hypothetical protein
MSKIISYLMMGRRSSIVLRLPLCCQILINKVSHIQGEDLNECSHSS